MADEKLLKDELLSEEQLEQVVGGNSYTEIGQGRFLDLLEGAGLAKYLVYSGRPRGYAGFACETLTNTSLTSMKLSGRYSMATRPIFLNSSLTVNGIIQGKL